MTAWSAFQRPRSSASEEGEAANGAPQQMLAKGLFEASIDELSLSTRVRGAVLRAGIRSVANLLNLSSSELRSISWIGEKAASEIQEKLNIYMSTPGPTKRSRGGLGSPKKLSALVSEPSLSARLADKAEILARIHIRRLGLSKGVESRLVRKGACSIADLSHLDEADLLAIPGFGLQSLNKIKVRLNLYLATVAKEDLWAFGLAACQEAKPSALEIAEPLSQEHALATFSELVDRALDSLTKRKSLRQVIVARYGIAGGGPLTLEETGHQMGITRERVRQIQQSALKELRHHSRKRLLLPAISLLEKALQTLGGISKTQTIVERLGSAVISPDSGADGRAIATLLMDLDSRFVKLKGDVWVLKSYPLRSVKDIVSEAMGLLKDDRTVSSFSELIARLRDRLESKGTTLQVSSSFLEACIRTDERFELTPDGRCRLAQLGKRYSDGIVRVLREAGVPMHFREIAAEVNKFLTDKQVPIRNVHAILQREKRVFVNVGPGTYGLAEWGLKPTVPYLQLIVDVLRSCGKPLAPGEIISRVHQARSCKSSSIMMYLTLDKRIAQFDGGLYGLAEWCREGAEPTPVPLPPEFVNQLRKDVVDELLRSK